MSSPPFSQSLIPMKYDRTLESDYFRHLVGLDRERGVLLLFLHDTFIRQQRLEKYRENFGRMTYISQHL